MEILVGVAAFIFLVIMFVFFGWLVYKINEYFDRREEKFDEELRRNEDYRPPYEEIR